MSLLVAMFSTSVALIIDLLVITSQVPLAMD